MNKALLKNYAPQARQDFIAAVIARAQRIGITEKGISPAEKSGDSVIIDGQAYPAKFGQKRDKLVARIDKDGFSQTMEAVAYTWFNRFAALRYLEIHDYLPHGHRVLSSKDGVVPDILTHAAEIAQNGDLADLNAAEVIDMKLAGDKDGELYRLMLLAQCNTLSNSMPFLFEKIDDETELLLPDNLLLTDSVIAKLVAAIPEEDWQEIEIIGWLYQFYISEKKDAVIGKVVKSEDIPAATQLFTPNWIVKYLVQNSIGHLWSMANPDSNLKQQWGYYIEPAEQSPEVQTQLMQLMQTRLDENGGSLNPETLKILDPACGSGHILVEAYDILKDIYLERGYRLRDIPRLILEKNLYGLDIDDRAAQLAGFALLMKARADDRRILENPPKLNILALKSSSGFDAQSLLLNCQNVWRLDYDTDEISALKSILLELVSVFENAETFGSLITIPSALIQYLPTFERALQKLETVQNDFFSQQTYQKLMPLVAQAHILAMRYDAVVANPPYMGGKGMNGALKDFAKKHFPDSKSDLFAMFIERGFGWCKASGFNAQVTMQSWMFLSSYEAMREKLLKERTISSFVQIGYNSFPELNSKIAQACVFSIINKHIPAFTGCYINLNSAPQSADKNQVFLNRTQDLAHRVCQDDLKKISGSPVAYWVKSSSIDVFLNGNTLEKLGEPRVGLDTGDNEKFIRYWSEVNFKEIGFSFNSIQSFHKGGKKYVPHTKGGDFRKWYGNLNFVLKFDKKNYELLEKSGNHLPSRQYYFRSGASWTRVSSSSFSIRVDPVGIVFNSACPTIFAEEENISIIVSFLLSKVACYYLLFFSPTLNFQAGEIRKLPLIENIPDVIHQNFHSAICIAKTDWNNYETSWDFTENPLIRQKQPTLKAAFEQWAIQNRAAIDEMRDLEEENNRLFIEAYGLQDELLPNVPEEQITLTRADREKDSVRLISYSIGCMMGRYSLDDDSLIYAHAGNVDFDSSRYQTFAADDDGIVPLTDEFWFEDDVAQRLNEFLQTVWGAESLENNKTWLAESLKQKTSETAEETLRRYLASNFYKDHLQTYKKRPIYWLFSSGKQSAFQALVYLHRYNESTLARMRNHYVVPLMGRLQNRIEMLEKDRDAATSPASKNKIGKEIERFNKKKIELSAFDEQLRHYADMRISLDLDDGVKVNYGKFGDLLSEVKAVTGGSGDE